MVDLVWTGFASHHWQDLDSVIQSSKSTGMPAADHVSGLRSAFQRMRLKSHARLAWDHKCSPFSSQALQDWLVTIHTERGLGGEWERELSALVTDLPPRQECQPDANLNASHSSAAWLKVCKGLSPHLTLAYGEFRRGFNSWGMHSFSFLSKTCSEVHSSWLVQKKVLVRRAQCFFSYKSS